MAAGVAAAAVAEKSSPQSNVNNDDNARQLQQVNKNQSIEDVNSDSPSVPLLSKHLKQHQQQYKAGSGKKGGRGGRGGGRGRGERGGNNSLSIKTKLNQDAKKTGGKDRSGGNQTDYWMRPPSMNSVNSISTLGTEDSCSGMRGALASNSSLSVSSSEAGSEFGIFEGELVTINNFDDELISADGSL